MKSSIATCFCTFDSYATVADTNLTLYWKSVTRNSLNALTHDTAFLFYQNTLIYEAYTGIMGPQMTQKRLFSGVSWAIEIIICKTASFLLQLASILIPMRSHSIKIMSFQILTVDAIKLLAFVWFDVRSATLHDSTLFCAQSTAQVHSSSTEILTNFTHPTLLFRHFL